MESNKVVLLCSTQNSAKHLPAWMRTVEQLRPFTSKIVFCENDSTDPTQSIIKSWEFPHELISFQSKPRDLRDDIYSVIAKNRQLLLERARALDPDYAIFLDDDVFPLDQNIIEKLTAHGLDIVGGTYERYFSADGPPYIASQWDVDSPIGDMPEIPDLARKVMSAKSRGVPFVMFTWCELKLYKPTVTSAGCLALSRNAIQDRRLNFFPKKGLPGYKQTLSEDFEFCLLARKLGYEIYLDGGTRLRHMKPELGKKRPWITVTYKY